MVNLPFSRLEFSDTRKLYSLVGPRSFIHGMEHDGMIHCPLDLKIAFYKWMEIEATWFFYVTWLFFMLFLPQRMIHAALYKGREGGPGKVKRHPLASRGRGQEGKSTGQTQDRDGRVTAIHAQNSGWNGQRRQTVSWLLKTMMLVKRHSYTMLYTGGYCRQSYMHRII